MELLVWIVFAVGLVAVAIWNLRNKKPTTDDWIKSRWEYERERNRLLGND